VLVVDDEPNLLRLVEYALAAAGHEVLAATTGQAALDVVINRHIDLVILDVMLPDVSGVEICRQLRRQPATIDLPVIMLSARMQTPDKIHALEAGADEYLVKPIDTDELVARVIALLARTRRLKQPPASRRGHVVGLLASKGGVGLTTIGLNLAAGLTRQNKTVVMVELRPCCGTLASLAQRPSTRSLSALLKLAPEVIDAAALQAQLVQLSYGPQLLFAPADSDGYAEILPEHGVAVVRELAALFDVVLVDFPAVPTRAVQRVARECALLALVAEPEPLCVQAGKNMLALLRAWGASGAIVTITNDRSGVAAATGVDARAEFGVPLLAALPQATDACLMADKLGTPMILSQPQHPASRALAETAAHLLPPPLDSPPEQARMIQAA
jgi:DNA-binding response OmpR family regulator